MNYHAGFKHFCLTLTMTFHYSSLINTPMSIQKCKTLKYCNKHGTYVCVTNPAARFCGPVPYQYIYWTTFYIDIDQKSITVRSFIVWLPRPTYFRCMFTVGRGWAWRRSRALPTVERVELSGITYCTHGCSNLTSLLKIIPSIFPLCVTDILCAYIAPHCLVYTRT